MIENPLIEKAKSLAELAENYSADGASQESQIISAMADVVLELVDTIDLMSEQLDAVDCDLGELEECFYEEDCDGCDEGDFYEVECPECHETIQVEADILDDDDEVECPACGAILQFDFEEDENAEDPQQ